MGENTGESLKRPAYRPEIDGLRAISILLVVGFHAGVPWLPGGYVGVDVFFVLSGFLITGLLLDELNRSGRIDLIAFVSRRARRLLPMAALVLVTTLIVGYLVLDPLSRGALIADARAAALYLANWRFADSATSYADTAVTDSLLLHYWSLAVEEQFYLVWPLLLAGVVALLTRTRASIDSIVAVVAGLVFATSLFISVRWTSTNAAEAYYATPARLWAMAAGAALVVLVRRTGTWGPRVSTAASAGGLVAIVAGAVTFDAQSPYPGVMAMLPVGGTLLLLASQRGANPVAGVLCRKPMVYLGRISYGWYLWHWPALGVTALLAPDWPQAAIGATGVVVSLALAAGSHVLVEQPLRHAPSLSLPARALPVGLALTLSPVLMGLLLDQVGDDDATVAVAATIAPTTPSRPNLTTPIERSSSVAPPTTTAPEAPSSTTEAPRVSAPPAPGPMRPADAREDTGRASRPGCHADVDTTAPPAIGCSTAGEGPAVVLIGDSHADHWVPGFTEVASQLGWSFTAWSKSGCAPVDVPIWVELRKRQYTECQQWLDATLDRIDELEEVDLVVVARASTYGDDVLDPNGNRLVGEDAASAWEAGVRRLLDRLGGSARQVVMLADTPRASFRVPSCLSENLAQPQECSFAAEAGADGHLVAAESRAGAVHISLNEAVCPGGQCPAATPEGIVTFRDQHHLTASYSRSLAPAIADALTPLVSPRD